MMAYSVVSPSGYELPKQQLRIISKALRKGMSAFRCGDTSYRVFYIDDSNTWYVKCHGKFNMTVSLRSE